MLSSDTWMFQESASESEAAGSWSFYPSDMREGALQLWSCGFPARWAVQPLWCSLQISKKRSESSSRAPFIHCSPIFHQASHLTERYCEVRHGFSLVNPRGLLLTTFLFFLCPKTISRNGSSITFPETEVRMTSLQFPRCSLIFLMRGLKFASLQPSRTSPICHDFFKDNHEWPCNFTSSLSLPPVLTSPHFFFTQRGCGISSLEIFKTHLDMGLGTEV